MNQAEITSSVNYPLVGLHPRVLSVGRFRLKVPFYVYAFMISLGLSSLCITAGIHTRSVMNNAVLENQQLRLQVQTRIDRNEQLHRQINALSHDPRTIEQVAREMGMVKTNEVLVLFPPKK